MPTIRARRIVRRAVMALAVVVLVPVWYVATWIVVSRAAHRRTISPATAGTIRPAFVPILSYCDSILPGSDALVALWWDAIEPGNRSFPLDVAPVIEPLMPSRMPPRDLSITKRTHYLGEAAIDSNPADRP